MAYLLLWLIGKRIPAGREGKGDKSYSEEFFVDALMIPVVQASKATAAVAIKSPAGNKTGANFSDYLEKKMATERSGKKSLFGLQPGKAISAADRKAPVSAAAKQEETGDATTTIAALLGQFIQDLQQNTSDQKLGPGEWSFPVPDPALLQKIAQDAGMSESQLASLLEKMKNQDGKLNLADFLASLSRHFQSLQEEVPVTAPETDLPLLQNVLERLGVPVTEVERVSEAAVRGDNTIDLQKLLAGLKELPGENITDLTAAEAEQLQDILANAGVSQQLQRALLPERVPVVEGLVKEGPPVTITVERLQNILEQAVHEVKANRLQADPLSFLADLQDVLSKSGFEAKGPSLSSAVQGTLVSVFEKLMESVDLSKVTVQPGAAKAPQASTLAEAALEKKSAEQGQEKLAVKKEAAAALAGEPEVEHSHVEGRDALATGASAKEAANNGEHPAENSTTFQAAAAGAAKGEPVAPSVSPQAARPFVHIPNLPPALQQQSFAQLSQGVLQGLRSQEHHLVLKLYPKELGEVKVEMTVRDNQVAVSFAMENSKVKEVLESNLDQFKENMEKQGFSIGECMVSLNRDTGGNESWQQFQTVALEKGSGQRRTTLADLPEDILYQRAQPENGRESGVDLFA